ncbi:hypothetical protein ABKN59_009949 [Abortiporus biennis]
MPGLTTLHTIPSEILDHTLIFCRPQDVSRFSQTCKKYLDLVYNGDQFLWRGLFLSIWDDPRRAWNPRKMVNSDPLKITQEYNWKDSLIYRFKTLQVIHSTEEDWSLTDALETLLLILSESLPYEDEVGPSLNNISYNIIWLEKIIPDSPFLTSHTLDTSQRQLRAQLRMYLGLSFQLDSHSSSSSSPSTASSPNPRRSARLNSRWTRTSIRSESRCFVYDLRNYVSKTLWGPYRINVEGQLVVNWEHIEHIANVIQFNMKEINAPWNLLCPIYSLELTRPFSAPRAENRIEIDPSEFVVDDWAGIEGTWARFISFMDYRELFAFNFVQFGSHPTRQPSFFDDHQIEEAARLIEMQVKIISDPLDTSVPFAPSIPSLGEEDPNYPPIRFKGTARGTGGVQTNNAEVRGSVYRYKNGLIRYFIVTYYDGVGQWRTAFSAEGVQLGGIQSAMGIAGIWTGADHDDGDPAGPFMMWKVSKPVLGSSS